MQAIESKELENLLEILNDCLIMNDKVNIPIKKELANIIKSILAELNVYLYEGGDLSFSKFIDFKRFSQNTQRALRSEYERMA